MRIFLLVLHPVFSWAFFVFFGLEAIQRQRHLLIVIVGLALCGFSQGFWKSELAGRQNYARHVILAFALGLSAAIAYPLGAIGYFLFNYS
jgi:hypothetical protein